MRKSALSARRPMDRKTRLALATLIAMILAGPAVVLRNCVIRAEQGSTLVAAEHPDDDGLIRLSNGATIHLHSQALARKFSQWLDVETDAKPAFEVADSNFAPETAEPTVEGRQRIEQLAQVLQADPQLHARIVVMTDEASSSRELGRSRADRIRRDLLAQHVAAANVTSAMDLSAALDSRNLIKAADEKSHLIVVISR